MTRPALRLAPVPLLACARAVQVIFRLLPGMGLCAVLAALAYGLQAVEIRLYGRAWLEALNIALLLGVGVRACIGPRAGLAAGVKCCARTLLNVGIMCMGATFSVGAVLRAGPGLLGGVACIVVFSLAFTCCVGRVAGLSPARTLLVACGNSICGNSAIMAAAPVIHAREADVGATIAFTAAGGLVVVLGLPLLALPGLDNAGHGVLAGLTVYAVPQVMAAASPFGAGAVQAGTLVKLMRVLMLGPVCLVLSVLYARAAGHAGGRCGSVLRLVPWYIIGFGAMMGLRAAGVVPPCAVTGLNGLATGLTVLAMAALGLGVELRAVLCAGRPLVVTVVVSLLGLVGASVLLVQLAGGG
ncbi:YeiH family protein [Komagataeibacter medellinensis]|uniref:Sulfate exporter family transporter n=1 Tax=Komagataeibacter medellinensis (strain NBRC 3288 / BCRC 11682 / LMG 1693 / Kondo 51) TaxID=634177 RepID=G2I407_KOMMN|nr:putative sulfate exporter family transporter [Komagataeibacter medellinensis]BAK82854.1 hypothetical protein GLX_04420 [Komagataeibacter medellinensis NBRC 3288]